MALPSRYGIEKKINSMKMVERGPGTLVMQEDQVKGVAVDEDKFVFTKGRVNPIWVIMPRMVNEF